MEKIDLVVPYVDASDKNWQAEFLKYNVKKTSEAVNAKNRFRGQGDFFRYFFRSVAKNMPWINNVFLLVMSKSQVPSWLDKSRVKVITHDMFMPKEALPTFNSGSIEMYLQNIPDLAEHFIYANDDMFAMNPLKPTDFFDNGKCAINLVSDAQDPNKANIWRQMCQNNHDVIFGTVKAMPYLRCDHEFRAYLKSDMKLCFDEYAERISNSVTMFRDAKNLTVFLFSLHLYRNKLTFPIKASCGYLCGESSDRDIYKRLRCDMICLNDTSENNNVCDSPWVIKKFHAEFGKRCKYENNDSKLLDKAYAEVLAKERKAYGKRDTYLYF